ncbi:hypothetical protein MNBD_ACTINO02-2153 [hydrothermal vent metagenome]|uniref:DUF427 domain-containing protein n=1 Tax=hydrothermal vent metagenome TaxID=652676 RepID=A0A3B0SSA9_9ZZZZ
MAATRPKMQIEPAFQRIRAIAGPHTIADSTNVKLVWETKYYPTFFFPVDDVALDLMVGTDEVDHSPRKGDAQLYDLTIGDGVRTAAARVYHESPVEDLVGYVALRWGAMDTWYEEDEEMFVHARDPYTRIDILQSSRNIRVEIDGVTVADSNMPRVLLETRLPRRFYLPQTDVRMDLLTPSDLHTECPYKGIASYWNVTIDGTVHENVVWGYPFPTLESATIAGYVAFWDEKLDVYVDGVLQGKPKTVFS